MYTFNIKLLIKFANDVLLIYFCFRLEEVKTSIVRMLVDRDLVAKENNDLKR